MSYSNQTSAVIIKSEIKDLIEKDFTGEKRNQIKPGLERIKSFLSYIGNPESNYKSVIIGGTNGKGSVTQHLSSLALKHADLKIGRYTSPHLISWNERFVINEKLVDFTLLKKYTKEILKKVILFEKEFTNGNDSTPLLTQFEIYTAIAFYLFAKEKIDIAFLEVGMGGRLDATNIISSGNTLCSVITDISLDHTKFLGKTISEIAYEKAGIIKEKNDIITTSSNKGLKIIDKRRKECDSNLILSKTKDDSSYIEKNIKLALTAWKVISKKIKANEGNRKENIKYLRSKKPPGRFEYLKDRKILLDCAHNPGAALELRYMLKKNFKNKKIIYIIGMLDKNYKSFIKNLIPKRSTVICTEPKSGRATKMSHLQEELINNASTGILASGINKAISTAELIKHDLIVITGSIYLIGEAMEILKLKLSN